MKVENPRAIIGANEAPDYATTVTASLERDYANLTAGAQELLLEARELPKVIDDEPTLGKVAMLIKRMRDTTARIESHRVKEKEPHMRSAQAVDSFFNLWFEKLSRRNNGSNPGAADILQARVNDFTQSKADEERRKREEAAKIAREESARLQRLEDAARQKASDAAAAAERARKTENIETHERAAEHHTAVANETQIDARLAAIKANEAAAATVVKTADIVRTRLDGGAMVTSRQVPVVELLDKAKLNKELLWPFMKDEHVLMALKAWAKTTSHKAQMDGASIGMRDEAVVR